MIDRNRQPSVFWPFVVGLFIPIVGFFMYVAWRENQPREAKAALIGAILCVIFLGLISILLIVLRILFVSNFF